MSLTVPAPKQRAATVAKPGRDAFQDTLGLEASIWCSLQVWELKAVFLNWDSLVTSNVTQLSYFVFIASHITVAMLSAFYACLQGVHGC